MGCVGSKNIAPASSKQDHRDSNQNQVHGYDAVVKNVENANKHDASEPSSLLVSLLPEDSLCAVLKFVGKQQYRYIGGVNRRFRDAYLKSLHDSTEIAKSTSIKAGLDSPQRAKILLDDVRLFDRKIYRRLIAPSWDFRIFAQGACFLAATYGKLLTLKYLRQQGCEWNETTCSAAAENGHLDVLQWASNNGCLWDELTCDYAALNGHLEVLQWARNNGCPWHKCTSEFAAWNGHFEVLQWARNNGCPWNKWACAYAALNGHLEVLKWARDSGCPWDKYTCSFAAENGRLEVLEWARSNRCPWDEDTCTSSAENGHWEVLQWARRNGCRWDQSTRERARSELPRDEFEHIDAV